MERLLLRPAEAGRALGLGRSTTYEMIRLGTLPSVRVGRSLRVPARALERWVEELSETTRQVLEKENIT